MATFGLKKDGSSSVPTLMMIEPGRFGERVPMAVPQRAQKRPGSIIIKVGTLDDPSFFKPKVAIFTVDKQPFHHIPDGVPAFERRPT